MYSLEKLNNINKCPHCGCKEIKEIKKHSQHCNGEWNEEIIFKCNYSVSYSPNFSKIIENKKCTNTKEHKEQINKRKAFLIKLENHIKKNKDIDEEFKNKILGNLKYI